MRAVAGCIGPTRIPLSSSPSSLQSDVAAAFREQVRALALGGADLIIIETVYDCANALAAISAVAGHNAAVSAAASAVASLPLDVQGLPLLPIIVSCTTVSSTGRLLSGESVSEFAAAVIAHCRANRVPLLALGLNCGGGPEDFEEPLLELTRATGSDVPVVCYPNLGFPTTESFDVGSEEGRAVRYLYPESAKTALLRAVASWEGRGVLSIAGSCCGSTPSETAQIAALCRRCDER